MAVAAGYPVPAPSKGQALNFTQLAPAWDVGFWRELTRLKLDVQRLDDSPLPVHAFYEAPPAAGAPEKCFFQPGSFEDPPAFGSSSAGAAWLRGKLQNFNTAEDFRAFLGSGARQAKVAATLAALQQSIVNGDAIEDPVSLRPLLLVVFADLKKHHFAYTLALPVLAPAQPWAMYAAPCAAEAGGFARDFLERLSNRLHEDSLLAAAGAFLLVRPASSEPWEVKSLKDLRCCTDLADENVSLGFVDPSSAEQAAGWPLRNLLMAMAHHRPGRWRVLAFRDPHLASRGSGLAPRSRVFFVEVTAAGAAKALQSPPAPEAQFAGWSKIGNFDLTAFLDQKQMAADAVDLNIKLMKWRLLPDLEPQKMQSLRCLLLGAGTLGCSVARVLMGWGVRRMTFLDSGKVSLSNPVRQSLFTHSDAASGRAKAQAARDAVLAVMPDAEVAAVEMEIPMPGHPHQTPAALEQAVARLRELVGSHDVVFMLTDSRESRWLPSLLVAASQQGAGDRAVPPLGITVALGFDSFLVSRQTHGTSPASCYFCNDVTAPADSLAMRTLDRQCTVTRPGLSGMASGVAVELLAALSQHQAGGFGAPVSTEATEAGSQSPLGAVPHQLRGFLADFRLAPCETEPFPQCVCCSPAVVGRFKEDGWSFVKQVTDDSSLLEEVSGLARMKSAVREDDVLSFDEFDDD